jgi:ornithine cyclodeaminase/alanine dehydrogenase-like protein (mu-crystallin family)
MSTREVVALVEGALIEHAEGRTLMPAKVDVALGPSQFFHGMPAVVESAHAAGMKWVSYSAVGVPRLLPNSSALLILNDVETGLPYAILDALWLTYARTAACAVLAIRHCAVRDARALTFVGGGVLPRAILPHLHIALPQIEDVRVITRSRSTAERFRDEMHRRTGLRITAYANVRKATADADVVLSAIGHAVPPPLGRSVLAPGMLALPMEGEMAWKSDALYSADLLFADDAEVFRSGFSTRRAGERVPNVAAEFAQVVAGSYPGRQNDDQMIFVSNNGIAVLDVVVGRELYLAAQSRGLGTQVPSVTSTESLVHAFEG